MNAVAATESSIEATTLGQLVESATRTLAATSDSPRLDAELLLAEAAGVSRSTVVAFPERTVDAELRETFEQFVARRGADVPIAYLLGQREFFSLTLEVGPGVLVPRPETELVVEAALDLIAESESVA